MPEAAVYKNSGAMLGQHNVWFTGELTRVQAKAKPSFVEKTADEHFGFGISPLNAGHHPATNGLGNNIHRYTRCRSGAPRERQNELFALLTLLNSGKIRTHCTCDSFYYGHHDGIAELPVCLRV